ncbi:hypothetical protein OS493_011846 [Desmophyllum pertusum]|uniref:Pentraxin (PTX) domain-containing protein n=1 Tax=Desmophyllum pertusum TaxID=174260 RepID=A0A9W9YEA2_9CNID|nr:hypothetical protein OS493_011846 [Desmophyllum pertusum]
MAPHLCDMGKTSGSWKFYKDGDMKGEGTLKRGHTIGEGGTLVLGQDQDSVGGDFEADQSFQGMLSNVNVWDEMLSPTRITEMATSCLLDEWNARNVYKWRNFLNEAETKLVKTIFLSATGNNQTSISAFNGLWHHICVTWEKTSGSWKFYKDGDMKGEGTLKKGYTIGEGGTLVLGQDQDSVGGDFEADQSFQGMLSNVNVWDQVLTADQVEKMSRSCILDEATDRKVYKWLDFVREGGATLVKPSPCETLGMSK